jgi:hypothetical protein
MTSFSYSELRDCFSASSWVMACFNVSSLVESWDFSYENLDLRRWISEESFSSNEMLVDLFYERRASRLMHFSCSMASYLSRDETFLA